MEISPKQPWKDRIIKIDTILDRQNRNLHADLIRIKRQHERNADEMEKSLVHSAFMVFICLSLAILLMMICCKGCHAYTLDQYAESIRITEGINSHYPYGIKSVHARNALEARKICKRTVWHKWLQYKHQGGNPLDSRGFINYLADRYCPPSVDYIGNVRWKDNMIRLMGI